LLLDHASGIGRQDVSEGTLIVDELVSADLSERSSPSELTERLETRERGRALSDSSRGRGSSRALLDDSRSVDDRSVLDDLQVDVVSRG